MQPYFPILFWGANFDRLVVKGEVNADLSILEGGKDQASKPLGDMLVIGLPDQDMVCVVEVILFGIHHLTQQTHPN